MRVKQYKNCFASAGLISDKTIAVNHPWVLNAEKEIKYMREDKTEEVKIENMYGTNEPAAKE